MLPEVKTILYATDLSKNSAFAYRYALSCAEKYGAMITIIHIIEDIGPWARSMLEAYLPEGHKEEVIKKSIQRIQKRLEVFCDAHARDNPECSMRVGSILVYEGNPAEEILKQAKKISADMIVMGSHGKGSSTHPFFGSVAKRVVGLSRVPVVVIPIPEEETEFAFREI
ncbi:MAG TPA: universal stress protein [Deltaproteobacteria bacterium]|jgi:nucleotide-binding universal stress UspA family protein|nr:universal stress protein [Deltaproteobacteria bacterium]MDI9543827.1 universal stress protein [Pseudomonadota bacterium]NLW67213.1 universal stress protein [Bacteriovoracaceae bacterium]HRR21588.1 universal stress protein [Desulfomonilia bacterium]HOE71428.1 universal stress protein [Deltaproteobacteria bacterium]